MGPICARVLAVADRIPDPVSQQAVRTACDRDRRAVAASRPLVQQPGPPPGSWGNREAVAGIDPGDEIGIMNALINASLALGRDGCLRFKLDAAGATHSDPGPDRPYPPQSPEDPDLPRPPVLLRGLRADEGVQARGRGPVGYGGWRHTSDGFPSLLPVASEFGEKNREGNLRVCYTLAKPRSIGSGSERRLIIDKYSYVTSTRDRETVNINGEQVDFFQVVILAHAAFYSGAHVVTAPPIKLELLRLFKGGKGVYPWMLCHGCGRGSCGGVLKPGCVRCFFLGGGENSKKFFLKSFFSGRFFFFLLSFFFFLFQLLFFSSHPTSQFPQPKTLNKKQVCSVHGYPGIKEENEKDAGKHGDLWMAETQEEYDAGAEEVREGPERWWTTFPVPPPDTLVAGLARANRDAKETRKRVLDDAIEALVAAEEALPAPSEEQ